MRDSAKATSSAIAGSRWWHTISMSRCSSMRVDRVGPRRIGRRRQHVRLAADLDDVGRVAAAGAFGVEGVDRAALERGERGLDEARLVERVGVDRDLHVVARRRPRGSCRSPPGVVPQSSCSLRPIAPASTCSSSAPGRLRVALAEEAEVHREGVGGLQHRLDVPRARACRWWRWCRSRGRCRRRSSW